MGGFKKRKLSHSKTYTEIRNIAVWCGNNDALEHRQNWDSRKKSYFELSVNVETEEHPFAWRFDYQAKAINRNLKRLESGEIADVNSPQFQNVAHQAGKSVYANVPRWIPENPGSFIWKCPRCKRTYQLNVKILEPYLDKLANTGQTRVSAAHLEAVQAEILHAKEAEATGNNRP